MTLEVYQQLYKTPQTEDVLREASDNLFHFFELLAEIDREQKEQSNDQRDSNHTR